MSGGLITAYLIDGTAMAVLFSILIGLGREKRTAADLRGDAQPTQRPSQQVTFALHDKGSV